MASVHIRTRALEGGGCRFVVRYRLGGRKEPVQHAGSFSSRDDAEARAAFIRRQIASGASVIRLGNLPEAVAEEFVYFIRQGVDGPIKIGRARNPRRRLGALQTASPYQLHLLATMPLLGNEEERLHAAFAQHQLMGEWFKPVPALLAYIREITGEEA